MKKLFFVLILLCPLISVGQKIHESDQSIYTFTEIAKVGEAMYFGKFMSKETRFVTYRARIVLNVSEFKKYENGKLLIKYGNEETDELNQAGTNWSERAGYTYLVDLGYEISEDQLNKLSEFGLIKIRAVNGQSFKDIDIKQRESEALKALAKEIINIDLSHEIADYKKDF